jgi:hypothetical protein
MCSTLASVYMWRNSGATTKTVKKKLFATGLVNSINGKWIKLQQSLYLTYLQNSIQKKRTGYCMMILVAVCHLPA